MSRRTVFAVLLIGIILLSFTPQNIARAAKSTKAQNSSYLLMYENVTTHEGDLIIDGTQTYAIENCMYIQTGSIQVRDWGRLIVRDSELRVNQTYLWCYNFTIEDYGTFEIDNSTLTSDRALNIDFNEYSEATFDSVTLNLTQTFIRFHDFSKATLYQSSILQWHGLYFDGYSEASITNSDITQIQVEIGVGACKIKVINSSIFAFGINLDPSSSVEVNHLRPGFIGYLNLQQATVNGVILDITLNDTSVGEWAVHTDYDHEMTISDSTIGRLGIYIHNHTVSLDSLNPIFYEYKEIGKLTLNKTKVTSITVFIFEDSVFTIINSTLRLYPHSQSKLYVNESVVSLQVEQSDFSGSLCFSGSTLQGIDIFNTDFYMCGTASLDLSGEFNWFSSSIKRNYSIILRDNTNNPTENAALALFEKNDAIVWNGTTNSLGQANFNLTFTDNNYTDTLRLEAVKGNLSATKSISFLSDTPVTMVLGRHDIAMTGVAPAKTVVGQGHNLDANFTVANLGDLAETFYATIYANATNIGTYAVFNLANGTSTTLAFACSTTELAYGNYTISANTQPVPGENFTANNNCTYGIPVHVGVSGDISGPTSGVYDGTVNMRDISYIIMLFNTRPDSPNWNPNADINNDATVNMRDISIAILNFNKHE